MFCGVSESEKGESFFMSMPAACAKKKGRTEERLFSCFIIEKKRRWERQAAAENRQNCAMKCGAVRCHAVPTPVLGTRGICCGLRGMFAAQEKHPCPLAPKAEEGGSQRSSSRRRTWKKGNRRPDMFVCFSRCAPFGGDSGSGNSGLPPTGTLIQPPDPPPGFLCAVCGPRVYVS